MSNNKNINYRKKMARLRYQDEILSLHSKGKSFLQITRIINSKLCRTRLKVKLSKTTVYNIFTHLKIIRGK